jgi:two-component system NarL family sensor kinase
VRTAGTIALWIADNGHGFDLYRAEGGHASAGENLGRDGHESLGLGLRNMRERVEGLGGTFHLTSTGSGTRIEVSLPAQPEHVAGDVAGDVDVDETHLTAALVRNQAKGGRRCCNPSHF